MRMVENWSRDVWRFWSVRAAALAGIIGSTWPLIPQDLRDSLPPEVVSVFALVAAGSIIFSRLVAQPKLPGKE